MIIGFGHKKRVGKDFACTYLVSKVPECTVCGFGDKLYDICHQLYGWAGFKQKEYYVKHPEHKERILGYLGKTPRQILVALGTTTVRGHVYDNTWVDYLLRTSAPTKHTLIADVRFKNEVDAIHRAGGRVIKIVRADVPNTDDVADCALDGFAQWDMVLNNDGSDGFTNMLSQYVVPMLGGL